MLTRSAAYSFIGLGLTSRGSTTDRHRGDFHQNQSPSHGEVTQTVGVGDLRDLEAIRQSLGEN